MKKLLKILLLIILVFPIYFTRPIISLATDETPTNNKDGNNQKLGDKIIITEDVKPVDNKDAIEKKPENSENKQTDKAESEVNEPVKEVKPDQAKKQESKEEATGAKTSPKSKDQIQAPKKPDLGQIEKVVDDMVLKLDKNSNLTKALTDVKTSIKSDEASKEGNKKVSEKTQEVLNDYNKKIQKAKTYSQRKEIENEAAKKIEKIKKETNSEVKEKGKIDDNKSKKLVIEVKSDQVDTDDKFDRQKIYALNQDESKNEEEFLFFDKPIIIVVISLIITILIAVGIVIKKNDRNKTGENK